MALTLLANNKEYQGRNMTDDDIQSVEQFKRDKSMHRLIRQRGGPEVYSIYTHLVDSASKKNDWGCWPSYKSIMEDLAILNRAVIADALYWLFDAGLIEWGLNGRQSWFIPLRKADSSVIELLRHIPSFRNRTKGDMNGSITEPSIVLIENPNVYQENVEENKTLSTNVLNGAEAPGASAIDSESEENLELEEIETQPEAASVTTAPPPDSRGLKRRWREAYEACQGDYRAQSGVMAKLWTEITGRNPDYSQLNGLAKSCNSQWVVCEGILKMANYEVMDNPLVFLRKVLSNGNDTGRTNRGRGERSTGKNGTHPAASSGTNSQHESGFWDQPDAEKRARAAWTV